MQLGQIKAKLDKAYKLEERILKMRVACAQRDTLSSTRDRFSKQIPKLQAELDELLKESV